MLFAPEVEADAEDVAQVGLYVAARALEERAGAGRGAGPWAEARLAGFRNGPKGGGALVLELERPAVAGSGARAADATAATAGAAATVVRVKPVTRAFGTSDLAFDVQVATPGADKATFANLRPSSPSSAPGSLSSVLSSTLQHLHLTPEPATLTAGETFHLFAPTKALDSAVSVKLPAWLAAGAEVRRAGSARAPMPSRVVQVMVGVGQAVKQGDPLVMVEAMKTVSQGSCA